MQSLKGLGGLAGIVGDIVFFFSCGVYGGREKTKMNNGSKTAGKKRERQTESNL